MKKEIEEIFQESIRVKEEFLKNGVDHLANAIRAVVRVIEDGGKIMLFGNGGSAADAQHIAAEFVNKFLAVRPPLPAIALTTDTSVLTAISNDFGFDEVFEKQVKAIGRAGDAVIGISTSGKSPNVIRGLEAAKDMGLVAIGLGGPPGAPMARTCHHYISVEASITPRVQELHTLIGHVLVELAEKALLARSG